MLTFPPGDLDRGPDGLPDDQDPAVRYRVPRLVTGRRADGALDFWLVEQRGGSGTSGWMTVGLRWDGALAGGARPVPWEGGTWRLVGAAGTGVDSGEVPLDADPTGLRVRWRLDAVGHALLTRLLEAGEADLRAEVRLRYAGRVRPLPLLARLDAGPAWDQLHAVLGDGVVTWGAARDAWLGLLDPALVTWRRAGPPDPLAEHGATRLAELAARARGAWFVPEGGGWRLAARPEGREDWDLRTARVERRTHTITWDAAELRAAWRDPAQREGLRKVVPVAGPFQATHLHVVNTLPLHPRTVGTLLARIWWTGPTGAVERREVRCSALGLAEVVSAVGAPFKPLEVRWRVAALVDGAPVEGPERVADGAVLVVDAGALGRQLVHVGCDPGLFALAREVEVTAQAGSVAVPLRLTAADPEAPLLLPPGEVRVQARVLGEAGAVDLPARAPVDGHVRYGAAELEPDALERVRIRLGPGEASPYVAVAVDDGDFLTLDPDAPLELPVRRASRLAPLAWRVRVRRVPVRADGTTGPVEDEAAREIVGGELVLGGAS